MVTFVYARRRNTVVATTTRFTRPTCAAGAEGRTDGMESAAGTTML
ncbi:MAG: hypothetical protein ABIN79_06005 [Marmoricola sp.]